MEFKVILNWPQIVMICLLIIEVYYFIYRNNKKDGKLGTNLALGFVRISVLAFVLTKGGFFG